LEDKFLTGRLEKKLTKEALEFLVLDDIEWDSKIIEEDITGNEAHTLMLWKTGIISKQEAKKILGALEKVRDLHREGKFKLKPEFEDVHLNVEKFVIDEVGMEIGGKLHTGRSRNDQIILDLRLRLRKEINEILVLLAKVIRTFLSLAEEHLETVMPGYTHLQHAQPITLAHWFTAYVEMFLRDFERIEKTYQFVNLNPLGACALAGTSWPISREETANLLGFDGIQENSLDVVTSRGEELAELLANLSILMVHLSRLSEDLILWTTYEFGMVTFDDSYAMTSSIMPQKKNPDVVELLRGKTSMVISQLLLSLCLMKGLPSGYLKDLQETKPAVFKVTETVKRSLQVVNGLVSTLKINKQRMFELAVCNFSTATDLADFLTRKTGIPFRVSHSIVGTLVRNAFKERKKATEVNIEDLKKASKEVIGKEISVSEEELKKVLNQTTSIKLKKSLGSPNPSEVSKIIEKNRKKIEEKEKNLQARINKLLKAEEKLQSIIKEVLKS